MPSPELIRATLRQREESARKVFAVGRRKGEEVDVVQQCRWCGEWIDGPPEGEHILSHGICPTCKAEHFPTTEDDR